MWNWYSTKGYKYCCRCGTLLINCYNPDSSSFNGLVCVYCKESDNPKYFESHITIEPVEGDRLKEFEARCKVYDFRVAELFMKRDGELIPSNLDSFCSGRDEEYRPLKMRMMELVKDLRDSGFEVRRYKVEAVVFDSRELINETRRNF